MPPYGHRVLAENKIKIHIKSGIFFVNYETTMESLYNFLTVQEGTTKKLLKVKINIDGDLDYYLKEVVLNITNDLDNLRANSISKFLFYNFNTLRVSSRKRPLLLRHSQIADDEYVLEKLQNKSWPYFMETLIEFSNKNVARDDICNEGEHDIIDKTVDKLNDCKRMYNLAFIDIGKHLKETLENTYPNDLRNVQKDLRKLVYYDENNILQISNKTDTLCPFSRYFFETGSFPAEKKIIYVPEGVMPPFVRTKRFSPMYYIKNSNQVTPTVWSLYSSKPL